MVGISIMFQGVQSIALALAAILARDPEVVSTHCPVEWDLGTMFFVAESITKNCGEEPG